MTHMHCKSMWARISVFLTHVALLNGHISGLNNLTFTMYMYMKFLPHNKLASCNLNLQQPSSSLLSPQSSKSSHL